MRESIKVSRHWPRFLAGFQDRLGEGDVGEVAYELFNFYRDRSIRVIIRDAIKAGLYAWKLFAVRRPWPTIEGGVDFCLVVDSAGVPGLSTTVSLLKSMPPQSRAVVVGRDFILRDPRLREFAGRVQMIDADRCRVGARPLNELCHEIIQLLKNYPSAWATIPQLVFRRSRYTAIMRMVLSVTSARAIIVSNERMMLSSCAINAAKASKTLACCLQHGALVEEYLPVKVDCYLTWGKRAIEWFRSRGVTARLEAIGAPRLDNLAKYIGRAALRLERSEVPVVCFFTQPDSVDFPRDHHLQVARELASLASSKDFEVWIKLHPADNSKRWESLFRESRRRIRIFSASADTYDLIGKSDYCGAFYSTVLIEAMLFPRPVFQLNPFGNEVPDYSCREGGKCVRTAGELSHWIEECESSPAVRESALARQRSFAETYFTNIGGASAAFFPVIQECLQTFGSTASEHKVGDAGAGG